MNFIERLDWLDQFSNTKKGKFDLEIDHVILLIVN